MATLVDPNETNPNTWFKEWYDREGKKYLNHDIRTIPGLKGVLKYHGLEEKWNQQESSSTSLNPAQRIYLLKKMLIEGNMKQNLYFSAIEGMHRDLAAVCVLTRSPPNPYTGYLTPMSLSLNSFKDSITLHHYPRVKEFEKALDKALTSTTGGMLNEPRSVKINYVTNANANMEDIVQAFKTKSGQISDGKLQSACPSATNKIAEYGEDMIKGISDTAIEKELQCKNLTALPTRKKKDAER